MQNTSTTSPKRRNRWLILLGIIGGGLLVLGGVVYLITKLLAPSGTYTPTTPTPDLQATVAALQQQIAALQGQTAATPTPTTGTTPAAPVNQQYAAPSSTCPTEAEFTALTGVVADKVGTEPCAFHWRGDPAVMTIKACPEGWACQLGVQNQGNLLYYGGDPELTIYAGTWRFIAAYPSNDAVQNPCQFLTKSQDEGRQSVPTWTIKEGNFTCP
ncbi:MAG: hypothetical protein ACK4FL_03890 [Microgenomates group bacterium]